MKTNVPIELTDEQRNQLANRLDGKKSARLATRKDVCDLVTAALDMYLVQGTKPEAPPAPPAAPAPVAPAGEPVAVVARSPDIPCANPTTEQHFPRIVADWYSRAKQRDESLASYIINDAEKRGIKVRT